MRNSVDRIKSGQNRKLSFVLSVLTYASCKIIISKMKLNRKIKLSHKGDLDANPESTALDVLSNHHEQVGIARQRLAIVGATDVGPRIIDTHATTTFLVHISFG